MCACGCACLVATLIHETLAQSGPDRTSGARVAPQLKAPRRLEASYSHIRRIGAKCAEVGARRLAAECLSSSFVVSGARWRRRRARRNKHQQANGAPTFRCQRHNRQQQRAHLRAYYDNSLGRTQQKPLLIRVSCCAGPTALRHISAPRNTRHCDLDMGAACVTAQCCAAGAHRNVSRTNDNTSRK